MHNAKKEPENQHQMAVAGPPAANGDDHVAQTESISEKDPNAHGVPT